MSYISITGLKLKSRFHAPRFWWHAFRSMTQAQRDPNCQLAIARQIDGIAHTITVWNSRKEMLAFLRSGSHRDAMRVFPKIGTGYGFGIEADAVPSWDEAHRLWLEKGEVLNAAE
jgi:hypothetical protein